jgi:nitric oxide reductase large subunit
MTASNESTAANGINAVLGLVLLVSPWLLGFTDESNAAWNAWIFGIAITVIAGAALSQRQTWEEWVNLILGIWVAISPWAVGFTNLTAASWLHLVIGVIVAVLAAVELWRINRAPPARAA